MRTPLNGIDPNLYVSGSIYTYQPLNPTTIWVRDVATCRLDRVRLLRSALAARAANPATQL